MSDFSLKNGLLMTYAHLIKDGGDSHMWFGLIAFLSPGIYGAFKFSNVWFGIIWSIALLSFFILVRCWDDPYKLGWLTK
jgi:hypothetical protein